MPRARLLPGGSLLLPALRLNINPGDEVDLPRAVIARHAGRFELLESAPITDAEPYQPPNVADYHVGGGWYAIPDHPHKVRKAEALLLLDHR
jgi:hypothetical protein